MWLNQFLLQLIEYIHPYGRILVRWPRTWIFTREILSSNPACSGLKIIIIKNKMVIVKYYMCHRTRPWHLIGCWKLCPTWKNRPLLYTRKSIIFIPLKKIYAISTIEFPLLKRLYFNSFCWIKLSKKEKLNPTLACFNLLH